MYLEAQETAQLYNLLSIKLGTETTDTLFKYIDNKTERSVEVKIKTLARKDDIAIIRDEMVDNKNAVIKWLVIAWIMQFASTYVLIILLLK
ncbi:MAG: hypothetical protein ABI367_14535 [Mucilaginibacter sp.]